MQYKVRVWKEKDRNQAWTFNMWRGYCGACDKYIQFWFFGATLGYMLEHIRRCDRFRYARSLAVSPVRPVPSADAFQTSGQELRGNEELFSKGSSLRSRKVG